jgi:hypothetical protein
VFRVFRGSSARRLPGARAGFLMTELVVALSIVAVVLLPLSLSVMIEKRLLLSERCRAVAMSVVDGETEVLKAGAWRELDPGTHPYVPKAASVATLPRGRFLTTLTNGVLRVEWIPAQRHRGGAVIREVKLP